MNLNELNDIKELKSMAYDFLVAKEQAENNLRMINQRIAELQESAVEKVSTKEKVKIDRPR